MGLVLKCNVCASSGRFGPCFAPCFCWLLVQRKPWDTSGEFFQFLLKWAVLPHETALPNHSAANNSILFLARTKT